MHDADRQDKVCGTLFVQDDNESSIKHTVAMKKYRCTVYEYIYDPEAGDPENGIAPGTSFDDLPDGWICPVCGEGKWAFEPVEE